MIYSFLFVTIAFILTRNFPLSMLTPISNICVLILSIIGFIHWFKNEDKFIGVLFLILTCFALYSVLVLGNEPIFVIRFYIILISLLCVHFIPFNSLKSLNIVLYLYVIQGLVVISLSLYLYLTWETSDYIPIRLWFQGNGFGDVYTYGNGFFRVQIKGNALIPFFAMISNHLYDLTKIKKYKRIEIFLLIATIFAGNFMFLIGSAFYYVCRFIMKTNYFNRVKGVKNICFLFLLVLFVPVAMNYAVNVIERKSAAGDQSSIGIRFDQADVLLTDMSNNVFTTLTGKGLGHTLKIVTPSRDYTGDIYFEVQTLYFLNQTGFVLLILYILALFYLYRRFMYFEYSGLIYLSYIGYAISNPYIFDTNHLVVIMTLCSINRIVKNKKSSKRSN
ncbi:hypothetical protein ACR30L_18555 [Psychromonas sp. PT13]|uniref:hypothetical protein n=1 Tax=Psychromonas sp. PT13 TaxID=3439547 RepID=UPI003EBFE9C9